MKILVVGVGNVLRGDDGFGVAVAELLLAGPPAPPQVQVMEIGIGGIHLVQELSEPGEDVDAVVVIDALDLGRPPGTVLTVNPEVVDARTLPANRRRAELADMHFATPGRALMLARSLDVLPATVRLVGCQPLEVDRPVIGLSPAVASAVGPAAQVVRDLVGELGVRWAAPDHGSELTRLGRSTTGISDDAGSGPGIP